MWGAVCVCIKLFVQHLTISRKNKKKLNGLVLGTTFQQASSVLRSCIPFRVSGSGSRVKRVYQPQAGVQRLGLGFGIKSLSWVPLLTPLYTMPPGSRPNILGLRVYVRGLRFQCPRSRGLEFNLKASGHSS